MRDEGPPGTAFGRAYDDPAHGFLHPVDLGEARRQHNELCGILRNRVIGAYNAWNPAEGSYAVGYHSVYGQFNSNFGPNVTIADLWHK